MKFARLLFVLLVGSLIFLVARPTPLKRQAQEAMATESEQLALGTFRIRMPIESDNDVPVADILWFQEAAEVAIAQKVPWFNVLEQEMSMDEVDGVIQLENDPMKAEYDANEILSLHLSDEVE